MSKIAKKAKNYYELGLWTIYHIDSLYQAAKITKDEYDWIVEGGEE